MIIAAVAIAGIANAGAVNWGSGAVNWGSGAIQTPGLEGVLSGSKLTSSSGYTLQMFAFESLDAFSYEAGDLFCAAPTGMESTIRRANRTHTMVVNFFMLFLLISLSYRKSPSSQ